MAALELLEGGDIGVQEQVDVPSLIERLSARAGDDHAIITLLPRILVPHICNVMALQS